MKNKLICKIVSELYKKRMVENAMQHFVSNKLSTENLISGPLAYNYLVQPLVFKKILVSEYLVSRRLL